MRDHGVLFELVVGTLDDITCGRGRVLAAEPPVGGGSGEGGRGRVNLRGKYNIILTYEELIVLTANRASWNR